MPLGCVQAPLQVPFDLASAGLAASGKEPPVTNCTTTFRGCLDYIWLARKGFVVSHWLSMPYGDDAPADPADVEFGAIPDSSWPSDHLAVGCKVQMIAARA